MAGYYSVVEGDYLSKIAADKGFTDYHTIWDHPNNATLKQTRQNPCILVPGDQVFIPDKVPHQESRSSDQHHTFVVRRPSLKLRLVLEDLYELPIAGATCTLVVQGQSYSLTSDGNGMIEQEIPPTAQHGFFAITANLTPFHKIQIPLKIGYLEPVDQVAGQMARLNNLGYFAGDLDEIQRGGGGEGVSTDDASGSGQPATDDQFVSAVEEFQCDHGLHVDGICGPITQAKLKQVHGC